MTKKQKALFFFGLAVADMIIHLILLKIFGTTLLKRNIISFFMSMSTLALLMYPVFYIAINLADRLYTKKWLALLKKDNETVIGLTTHHANPNPELVEAIRKSLCSDVDNRDFNIVGEVTDEQKDELIDTFAHSHLWPRIIGEVPDEAAGEQEEESHGKEEA